MPSSNGPITPAEMKAIIERMKQQGKITVEAPRIPPRIVKHPKTKWRPQ